MRNNSKNDAVKKVVDRLNVIFCNKEMVEMKKLPNIYYVVPYTTIKSLFLYRSEIWRLTEDMKRRVEVVEMDAKFGNNFTVMKVKN